MSTGLMAGLVIKNTRKISMLVTRVEVDYIKQADAVTLFECDEGIKIIEAVQQAIDTKEGTEVILESKGTKKDGTLVAKFRITWSFKLKGN